MNKLTLSITICFVLTSLFALPVYAGTWTETTFADFADGRFDAGGNIVASADGKLTLTGQQWDLNNDGFLDIVFSNWHNTSHNINSYIYWGSASGFSSGNKMELPTHGAVGNSVADLNGDGFLDIVFSNAYDGASCNINSYIYWGSASGFSSGNKMELPTHYAVGNSVADLNSDGFLDIVFSNSHDGTPYNNNLNSVVYWGSASGFSSGNKTELPIIGARGNSVADLNGDGFLDIVFSNYRDDTSYNLNSVVYWGSTNGFSSGNKTELPTHGAAGNSVADLNGDGFLDIVFCNYSDDITNKINSYIYWGSASGFSSDNKTELPTIGANSNSVADLNGDGFLDIVFSSEYADTSYNNLNSVVYWGSASGFSSGNKTELPTIGTWGDSVADFNDDGFLDIVFNNERDDTSFDINSYIYWGSVSGFSSGNKTELPTHGARFGTTKDLGDAYTRQPEFVYISSADDTSACNSHFDTLSWDAQTPPGTYVQFQIRTAETQEALASASWYGPTGSDRYTVSGTPINSIHSGGRWVQYRVFLGTNYINTPTLDSVTITFNEDTTPPVISSVTATPNLLWPPNHQLVTVTVSVTASDDSGSPVTNQIVSVTSNEPDDGLGDGDTPNDIQNINELTVQLRAERSGKGTGRIYTITVSSTDACGNTATATVAVTVPKNQGKGAPGLVPAATALSRNYPNPFNPETWIPFALASDTDVTIKIFDVRGKLVRRLDLGSKEAGFYMEHSKAAYWDGRNDAGEQVSSGVYFYTLEADTFTATRKMVIAR